jgi:hypothetical protein
MAANVCKDTIVNTRNRLAKNSTLLALGLALITAQGVAGEATTTADEARVSSPTQLSRDSAKAANEAAASDAVKAVIEANRLDLDIRLIGRTSITIAARK